jgi:hypothetical protein
LSKHSVMIFFTKSATFLRFLGENILRIITSVPGERILFNEWNNFRLFTLVCSRIRIHTFSPDPLSCRKGSIPGALALYLEKMYAN